MPLTCIDTDTEPTATAPTRSWCPATAAEACGVALFTVWVIWPLIQPGRFVTGFDTVTYSGPNLALALDAVRHGRLAQWNPFIYGGVSNVGNINAASLYPLKWLFAWTAPDRAWSLLVALHLVGLAGGMYWLARRRLRLLPPAGLVATVAVMGSGMVMVRALFFEQILVLAWAPWLLGALDAAIGDDGDRRARATAGLALVVAAIATAGHAQMGYILFPLAAVWAVARAVDHHGPRWWRRLGPVVAGGVLGVLLAMPQLLPAAELASRSANTGGRDLAAVSDPAYSIQLKYLPGTWLGDPLQTLHTTTSNGYENLTFVGVVATLLGAVAVLTLVVTRRRAPLRWPWTVGVLGLVVAGGLVLAVGPRLVIYRLLFAVVPGFDQARVPARWATDAVLATGLLAGIGIDLLRRSRIARRTGVAVTGATLVAATLSVVGPFAGPGPATVATWVGLALACLLLVTAPVRRATAVTVVLALLLMGELGLAQRHSALRGLSGPDLISATPSPAVNWLRDHRDSAGSKVFALTSDQVSDLATLLPSLRPNANVWAGLASPDGYDGGIQATRQWADAFAPLADGPFLPVAPARGQIALPLDPDTFARFGVRWVLLDRATWPAQQAVPAWGDPVFEDGDDAVFENPAAHGAARLQPAGRGTAAASTDDSVGSIALSDLVLRRPTPEHLVVSYDAPEAGMVVVDEQWDPGWTAQLDGTPVEVVPVGPLGLGVATAAGPHRLELRFQAPHLALGSLLCGLALALVVAMGAQRLTSRRRR